MAASDLGKIAQRLQEQPHVFLQPSRDLHTSFLELAKTYLDPLASSVTESQDARQKQERLARKRKRRAYDVDGDNRNLLRMKQVHVSGFNVQQVWQQAKRVLGAAAEEVERDLPDDEEDGDDLHDPQSKKVHFAQDGESEFNESDDESLGEEGVDWEYDGDDVSENGGVKLDSKRAPLEDDHSDAGSLDIGEGTPPSEVSDEETGEVFVKDKHGLNDGFFSIDQFNKQSQFLEQLDARGGSDDGAASDEEDIDWGVDPLSSSMQPQTSNKPKRDRMHENEEEDDDSADEDESEDDDDGPTFGNMDLDAPEGDSDIDGEYDDEDMMDDGGFSNTNNITYKDFFAPPARNPSKKQKLHKARLKALEKEAEDPKLATELDNGNADDAALERTISSVHRDLFDDDLSDDPDQANADPDAKTSNLSTHERRQLALREQIRRLEAANVAAKPWSLTGETLAPARPLNSLLEEDLDFERAGKPVPVITEEVSEDIEALIKRRIIALDFDEVRRRRPNDPADGAAARRGRVDTALSDAKPQKSLADEYAEDHLRATDPNYTDTRTAKLRAAHASIEAHWAAVSAQLDALCNWHYKPKPPAPSLEVRVDAPTISMEDARPTAAEGEMGGEGMLAPQEVWNKSMDGKREGEVVTKGGAVVAREEQTREQKLRRRRREKERIKKAGGNVGGARAAGAQVNGSGKKESKKNDEAAVVGQLKKGGVKVIDKKGALRDVEGRAVEDGKEAGRGAGNFKL